MMAAEVSIPALMVAWDDYRTRSGRAWITMEDLGPHLRAGLLLFLASGERAPAFEFAHESTLTASRSYAKEWLETTQIIAAAKGNAIPLDGLQYRNVN